jgi:hypothetical protein
MNQQELMEKLIEANSINARSVEKMSDVLKELNDSNILHQASNTAEHAAFADKMNFFVEKYWKLLLITIILAFSAFGVREALAYLKGLLGG